MQKNITHVDKRWLFFTRTQWKLDYQLRK